MKQRKLKSFQSRSNERAASLIEAAIAFPIVISVLLGSIALGLYYSARTQARAQAFNILAVAQIHPGLEDPDDPAVFSTDWVEEVRERCQTALDNANISPLAQNPRCEVSVPPQEGSSYKDVLERVPLKISVVADFSMRIPFLPAMSHTFSESAVGYREVHKSPNAPPLIDCFGRKVSDPTADISMANCPCNGDPMKVTTSSCSGKEEEELKVGEEDALEGETEFQVKEGSGKGGSTSSATSSSCTTTCSCRPGTVTLPSGNCKCPIEGEIFNLNTLQCECAPCGPNEVYEPNSCQCRCADGTVGDAATDSCACANPLTTYQDFIIYNPGGNPGSVQIRGCYCPNYGTACSLPGQFLKPDPVAGCGCRCNSALPVSRDPINLELVNGSYQSTIDAAYCKAQGKVFRGQQEWWCVSQCVDCGPGTAPDGGGTTCVAQEDCTITCPQGQIVIRDYYDNSCKCINGCRSDQVVITNPDGTQTCSCPGVCPQGSSRQSSNSCACTCTGACSVAGDPNSLFTPENGCNCACGPGRYADGAGNCVMFE